MSYVRLFTPGPIDLPAEILKKLSQPLIYHRSKDFAALYDRVKDSLKKVVATDAEIVFFCASGTGAMEAAVVNLLSPNEDVLVAVCGRFGERWLNLCKRYGVRPQYLSVPYGESIPPEKIEELLNTHPEITTVFTTLTETSTGALLDIKRIGAVTRKLGKILVVDGIAGIAADEFYMDDWQVDVLIGASQKALMAPPGVSFLAINRRGEAKAAGSKLPRYYWDLATYKKFASDGQTPYTPAISVFFALDASLSKILKNGMDSVFKHHRKIASALRKGIEKMGLRLFARSPSSALTVIEIGSGVDATKIVASARDNHHILFANGQADLKGRIVRIGHMGEYSSQDILEAIKVFGHGCQSVGLKVDLEDAVAAVEKGLL